MLRDDIQYCAVLFEREAKIFDKDPQEPITVEEYNYLVDKIKMMMLRISESAE